MGLIKQPSACMSWEHLGTLFQNMFPLDRNSKDTALNNKKEGWQTTWTFRSQGIHSYVLVAHPCRPASIVSSGTRWLMWCSSHVPIIEMTTSKGFFETGPGIILI